MANESAQITLSANATEVERALAKMHAGLDKTVDKLNRLEKASQRSGKASQQTMQGFDASAGKAVATIGQLTGALVGVGSATSALTQLAAQLRRELENIRSRQKDIAGENLEFEPALAGAVRNAAGLLTPQEVKQQALELAERTGASQGKAAATIGAALSASAPTNREDALRAIRSANAALEFAPDLSDKEAASLASAGASIAKRFGTTPESAIGFVQNVAGQANITDLPNVVQNVAPAASNLTQFGFSPQGAGALISTLTQGMGDTTGATSATAGLALAASIRERFGDQNPEEVIRQMQQDPALRKVFLEGGKIGGKTFSAAQLGEGKAKPTIENILSGGQFAEQMAASEGAIGGFREGAETFQTTSAAVKSVTPTSRLQRMFQSTAGEISSIQEQQGLAGLSREGLQDLLKKSGASSLRQFTEGISFDVQSGAGQVAPLPTVAAHLRGQARQLTRPTEEINTQTGELPITIQRDISAEDRNTAEALSKLADKLEALDKELQANRKALEDNTNKTQENTQQQPSRQQVSTRRAAERLSRGVGQPVF